MSPLLLIALPLAFGAAVAAGLTRRAPSWLLVGLAFAMSVLAIVIGVWPGARGDAMATPWITADATARLFLMLVNVLFLGISAHAWNRFRTTPELRAGSRRFVSLSLVFMGLANAVILSNHLLVTWIALEGTSIAAAPLIVRPGAPASRRASWTYLLFSTVGLGLALLGLACLARSLEAAGLEPTYFLDELAPLVSGPADVWRQLGLALMFLGLGTKLGLAPMYSWLPEAYDEAPPAVTALLAAVQFNCALVAVLRVLEVYRAGQPGMVSTQLVMIGLASMAVSTFSIIGTTNFQRLIAYASINHAGVIAIGLGLGKDASYGLILYVVSNAFIKTILFLTAGKIQAHYGTKDTREIAGLIKDLPYSGLFLMVGTFALLGFPPFGSFLGELLILAGLIRSGQTLVFVAFCALITMTFVATGRAVFPMIWGQPKREVSWPRQTLPAALPKLIFLGALIAMGLYLPPALNDLFRQVAARLGAE